MTYIRKRDKSTEKENSKEQMDLLMDVNSPLMAPNSLEDISAKDSPITEICKKAADSDLSKVSTSATKSLITKQQCKEIIEDISKTHGLTNEKAFAAIALLFLKGAANKAAPLDMSVDIITEENNTTSVCKVDLVRSTQKVVKNGFIRRVAEALAAEISYYAEKHYLNGDLAIKLDTLLRADEKPSLTRKEKAWANSFAQNLPGLERFAGPRIPYLLALDYNNRFSKQRNQSKKGKSKSEPARPKGPGQGKKKGGKQK
jgi:hypothetical protein